jgi:hypothetical protein
MYRHSRILIVILILGFTVSLISQGEIERKAFNLSGTGARSMGMAGAVSAIGGDPSSGFWNPAGLASIKDSQITLSYNLYGLNKEAIPEWGSSEGAVSAHEFSTDISGLDYISLTLPFRQSNIIMVHQIAFHNVHNFKYSGNLNNPFEYTTLNAVQQGDYSWDSSGALQALTYAVGFQVWDFLQVGAAYHHYVGGYDYTNTETNTYFSVDGDFATETISYTGDWNFLGDNFTIGIIVTPFEYIRLSATFSTNYDLKAQYDDKLEYSIASESSSNNASFASSGEAKIKHPSEFSIGLAVFPMKNLTLATSYSSANWKADVNDSGQYLRGTILSYNLPYHPDNPPYSSTAFNYPTFTEPGSYEQKADTYIRIGGEYIFDYKKFDIAVRAGYWQHQSLFTDAGGDSIDFTGITGGIGFDFSYLKLDIAWVMTSGSYSIFQNIVNGPETKETMNLIYAQISYVFESF